MENNKLGKEPAFPEFEQSGNPNIWNLYPGMSKRFYAACAAMQGIITNSGFYWQGNGMENLKGVTSELAAKLAYEYADELLKQENL